MDIGDQRTSQENTMNGYEEFGNPCESRAELEKKEISLTLRWTALPTWSFSPTCKGLVRQQPSVSTHVPLPFHEHVCAFRFPFVSPFTVLSLLILRECDRCDSSLHGSRNNSLGRTSHMVAELRCWQTPQRRVKHVNCGRAFSSCTTSGCTRNPHCDTDGED